MPNTRLQKVGETDYAYCQAAARYARATFNKLRWAYENQHLHHSHIAAMALKQTEARFTDLGTCGVEGDFEGNGAGHITIQYLNSGDSYGLTVLYYNGRFIAGNWGDIAEKKLT